MNDFTGNKARCQNQAPQSLNVPPEGALDDGSIDDIAVKVSLSRPTRSR